MARSEIPLYTTNQIITSGHGNTYWRDNEAAHWSAINGFSGDYVLIEEKAISASGTIDFQNITQSYEHLELFLSIRGAGSSANVLASFRLNNDSGSNYDYQVIYGEATGKSASEVFGNSTARIGRIAASTAFEGLYSASSLYIPNYTSTGRNKVVICETNHKEGTSSGNMRASIYANFWRSNSAINRITITTTLAAGSVATLYGVK